MSERARALRQLLDDLDAADIRRRGRLDGPEAIAVRRLIERQCGDEQRAASDE